MNTRFRLQDVNPLRGLREEQIPEMALAALRGDLADWAWLIFWITRSNYAVIACVKKLTDALSVMDWDIKIPPDLEPAELKLAEEQQSRLRAAYDKIGNLKKALKHLALGEIYGYAHLEKIYAGGLRAPTPAQGKPGEAGYVPERAGDPRYVANSWEVVELRTVDQWYWSRKCFGGAWLYNQEARSGYDQGAPINLRDWVLREVNPPLADVLARSHHKMELADDDWAQHDDSFAVPPIFVEGPPNASKEQEDEFQAIAEEIVANGRGYLPNGAKVHTVEVSPAGDGFSLRLKQWESAIVLVVTRGKQTMLSEAKGIGNGEGDQHGKGWDDVAGALALDVSESMQEQFDEAFLDKEFPGQRHFAYFEFAKPPEEDVKAHSENAKTLKEAGYAIGARELSEKTGYTLTAVAAAGTPNTQPGAQNVETATMPAAESTKGPGVPPPVLAVKGTEGTLAQPGAAAGVTDGGGAPSLPREVPPIARPSRAGEASPGIVEAAVASYADLEAKWLGPVKPILDLLEVALNDPETTLEQLEKLLERAHDALPGLIPKLGIGELAKALEEVGAPAAMQGTLDAISTPKGPGGGA